MIDPEIEQRLRDAFAAWSRGERVFDHVDGILTRFEPFLNRVNEARAIAAGG